MPSTTASFFPLSCPLQGYIKINTGWWPSDALHRLKLKLRLQGKTWLWKANDAVMQDHLLARRMRFCRVLQKFFTSLSVRPGKQLAILAHLLPNLACISTTNFSSSGENLHPLLCF